MNGFYQSLITTKSWQILLRLKKDLNPVIIGGWAVYLYTKALKSKDIDILIDFDQLAKLRDSYEVAKNDRLKKYEIKEEGIDVDIYLPHYSYVGLKVQDALKFKQMQETFLVLKKEVLLITKLAAYESRRATIKGQKDTIDIISLLRLEDFDFNLYKRVLDEYKLLNYRDLIISLLRDTKEAPELDLNRHTCAQLKKRILSFL